MITIINILIPIFIYQADIQEEDEDIQAENEGIQSENVDIQIETKDKNEIDPLSSQDSISSLEYNLKTGQTENPFEIEIEDSNIFLVRSGAVSEIQNSDERGEFVKQNVVQESSPDSVSLTFHDIDDSLIQFETE